MGYSWLSLGCTSVLILFAFSPGMLLLVRERSESAISRSPVFRAWSGLLTRFSCLLSGTMYSEFWALKARRPCVAIFFESVKIVGLLFIGLKLIGTEGAIFFGLATPENRDGKLVMPVYLFGFYFLLARARSEFKVGDYAGVKFDGWIVALRWLLLTVSLLTRMPSFELFRLFTPVLIFSFLNELCRF